MTLSTELREQIARIETQLRCLDRGELSAAGVAELSERMIELGAALALLSGSVP